MLTFTIGSYYGHHVDSVIFLKVVYFIKVLSEPLNLALNGFNFIHADPSPVTPQPLTKEPVSSASKGRTTGTKTVVR